MAISSNARLASRQARNSAGEIEFRIQPRGGFFFEIATRDSVFLKGSGFRSMAYTAEKMAVFAPMPMARVRMAAAAKPGLLRSVPAPKRKSCQKVSSHAPER